MNPIAIKMTELKPALVGLGKVINKRLPAPVLGCVRIERTNSGNIELAATNLDVSATVRLDTSSQGDPIAFLLPYEDLNNIAKSCGRDDTLFIAPSAENRVIIKFPVGGQIIEHTGEAPAVDEFPEMPDIDGAPVVIDDALRKGIQDAFGCASVDPTRPVLNGVFLDVANPDAHYIVATDGRHLFSGNSFALPLKEPLMIPSHRFLGWKEFNADGQWNLRVAATGEGEAPRLEIASHHWRFSTRSTEGAYPNWRAVVPNFDNAAATIEFAEEETARVIQAIARMPDHDPLHHSIGLEVDDRRCWLLGRSPSAEAWTRIELGTKRTGGADMKIFLNRQLFIKALRFGLTKLQIIDPSTPFRFSSGGRQMIVMPVHQEGERTAVQPRRTATPQPVATIPGSTESRKPMPETTTTAPEATPVHPPKPALEAALGQIETIKTQHRETLRGLNELVDLLRQAGREQRTSEKEVHAIRQTLRSLQNVRI